LRRSNISGKNNGVPKDAIVGLGEQGAKGH